ncbi:MAG: vWA domain-containing protein [Polyangiales bacterium]
MWTRTQLSQLLVTGYCVLGACSAQTAPPSSRGSADPGASAAAGAPGSAPTVPVAPAAPTTSVLPPARPVTPVGTSAGPKACEVVQLVAEPQVPDMMIVLDRSGSMDRGGRWLPSVAAVRKITAQLQDRIRFGLMLFPGNETTTIMTNGTNGGFQVSFTSGDLCTVGTIAVPIAEMNAAAIGMTLDVTFPDGGTPTSESLMQLVSSFATTQVGPDMKPHPKYVLLVTDGAPTCPTAMGNGDQPNQPDVDLTNKAVDALTASDVKTFVVGYDTATPGNEPLAQVLDGFAQRGGTGDQKHRPVEDEASLTAVLESITASIASCSFKLDKAPERADFVLVTLDGKQLNLDDANGWRLVDDQTVEIVGDACTTFKSGPHLINAEVQCELVQPS